MIPATKAVIISLALLAISVGLSAVTVQTLNAVDVNDNTNHISITLSDVASSSVISSSDGISHSLIIRNTKESVFQPQYKRLSPVIDRIITSYDGSGTTITIRTMRRSSIKHAVSRNKISLVINQEALPKNKPKPKARVASPLEEPLPPYVNRTYMVMIEDMPDFEDVESPEIDPVVDEEDAVEEPLQPKPPKKNWLKGLLQEHWLLLVIICAGIIALLLLVFIIRKVIKRPKPVDTDEYQLISEDDTLGRMVLRLHDDGWTPAQISAEMRLPQKVVKRLVAGSEKEP